MGRRYVRVFPLPVCDATRWWPPAATRGWQRLECRWARRGRARPSRRGRRGRGRGRRRKRRRRRHRARRGEVARATRHGDARRGRRRRRGRRGASRRWRRRGGGRGGPRGGEGRPRGTRRGGERDAAARGADARRTKTSAREEDHAADASVIMVRSGRWTRRMVPCRTGAPPPTISRVWGGRRARRLAEDADARGSAQRAIEREERCASERPKHVAYEWRGKRRARSTYPRRRM